MQNLEEFLKEMESSEEEFLALIDGDWHNLIWSSSADDGSPYGAPGFADENGMFTPDDIIEDAKQIEDEDSLVGLQSDTDRIAELIAHQEEREMRARQEKAREKRERTKQNRKALSDRFEARFDESANGLTMKEMRRRLAESDREQSAEILAKVFKGFGM